MTADASPPGPVPSDFPWSGGGAVSGAQPKLAVRRIAGEFVAGSAEDEQRARYDACLSLVDELVMYSQRKRTQLADLSLQQYMRRVREAVVLKRWDLDAAEVTWVMQRLTVALGGEAADVPLPRLPASMHRVASAAVAPVETVVDRARALLRANHPDPD